MHNKVVHTLARTYARRGMRTVRFNYRGVGNSAGSYADGIGETQDALAVVDWIMQRESASALHLAGFSFGGMVALRAALERLPASLVTVAPAVRFFDGEFRPPECRWLVLQGEADEIVSAADVGQWVRSLSRTPTLQSFSEVGHFFHGALGQVGDAVNSFLDASNESESER